MDKGPKWKLKGPHFKGPKIKGPSFSLPRFKGKGGQGEVSVGDVDIVQEPYGGKVNVEGGDLDLDIKGPAVEAPDLSVELPEGQIEGELPEGDIDVKGPKWKLKGPHFKGPNIKGPSFSLPKFKGRGGGQGEVSIGDVDVVQEPYGGKVDIPGGEFDVDIKGPKVDSPDLNVELPEGEFEGELPEGDVDIKGPKWKIKGPHFKAPHIKGPNISLPKWSKGGQGEVSVGDVDIIQEPYGGKVNVEGGDLDLDIKGPAVEAPDLSVELPEGEIEGELPEGDIDVKGPKWKLKGPHFKGPNIKGPSFSLPKFKGRGGGQGEVSVGDVDIVQEPYGGKVNIEGGDLDLDIKGPEVEAPDLSVEVPEGQIEGELPEGDIDVKGPKWKLKGPHFKGPNIKGPSFSLPRFKGKGGQGEVSVGDVDIVQEPYGGKVKLEGGDLDVDIKGPEVEAPDLNVEVPEGQIEGELPEGDINVKGPKWKLKGPHFKGPNIKGPSFSLPRFKGKGGQGEVSVGDVDIVQEPYGGKVKLEGGDLDVDIKGPEVEAPDLNVEVPEGQIEGELPEGDINVKGPKWKLKGPHFKGPKIKGPSFSLPRFKGKGGQGEVSVGDVDIVQEPYGGKVNVEGGDLDLDIKGPAVEAPDLSVELPEGEIEGELPEGDIDVKGPKWKLKGPHFKGPNIKGPSFSLPKFKGRGGGQGEVSVGDVDIVQEPYGGKVNVEGGDLDLDIKGPEVEAPDLSVELPEGQIEGELPEGDIDVKGPKWKLKGPHFKGPNIKGPSFSLPKFKGRGGGQGEVSVGDVDIVQEPYGGKVDIPGGEFDVDIKGPEVDSPDLNVELPEGQFEGELPEGDVDIKGPKWKIKGPHFKAPHIKGPNISLPKWSKGGQGEVSVGDVDIIQEPYGGKLNVDGADIDLDVKGPGVEAPDLSVEVPEGQIEGELPEGDINVKGPKWKLKGPHFKGPNIKGPSFSLPRFKGKGGQGEVSVGDVDIVQEPYGGKVKLEGGDLDVDIKGPEVEAPDLNVEVPEGQIEGELPEGDINVKGPKWKLKGPHFKGPNIKGPSFSLPRFKGKGGQGEVSVGDVDIVQEPYGGKVKLEGGDLDVDIKGPAVEAPDLNVEVPEGQIEGELPEGDINVKGPKWKLKGPHFKGPKIKGPSFSLPRFKGKGGQGEVSVGDVDIVQEPYGGKVNVEGGDLDLDIKGPAVEAPDLSVELPEGEIEGELPEGDIDVKGPKWKLKGPHFKGPNIKGPSFSLPKFKGRGGQGEVSVGDVDIVQEPYGGKVNVEGGDLDLDIKGPEVEAPDLSVELPEGEIEGELPEGDVDVKGPKWKLKGPHFKGPNIKGPSFSLPKFKGRGGGQGEVSVGDVDIVQEPYGGKVDIPGGEFDVDIKGPEVDSPDLNVELPEGEFEGELPEGDVDIKGPKWKIKGPHFKAPHIKGPNISLPKWSKGGQGEVSVGDVDIIQEPYGGKLNVEGGDIDLDVKGPGVEAPDLSVEVPEGQIEGELPEGDIDVKGPKWKLKGPHFKGPKIKGPSFSLPRFKGKGGQGEVSVGDVDIVQEPYGGKVNVEGGDLDIDIKGPEVEAPDLNVEVPEGQIEGELPEGDINVKGPKWKLKGPHFKGPNIKGPSFSLPRFKGKGGQGEVSVGDVDIVQEPYGGKVNVEGGDLDLDIKGPAVEAPDLSVEVPEGQIEGELPEGDIDVKGPKWKLKGPHFKGPNIKGPSFSLPKFKGRGGGQGEVSVGDVDVVQEPYGGKVDIPGGEFDVDIKGPEVDSPDLNVELPEGEFEGELPEGDVDIKGPKWKIKGPHFKAPHIKGPNISLPKWSKGGQGEVSVGDVDIIQEPYGGKLNIEGGDIDLDVKGPGVEAPDLSVEVPEGQIEGELPEGDIDVKGPKWKIKGPHFKGPKIKGPSFSLPRFKGKGGQGEVSVGDVDVVQEPYGGKVNVDGPDLDVDIKGPEVEAPDLNIKVPEGQIEGELPEGDINVKGPKWKLKGPHFKGPNIKGPSFSLPKFKGRGGGQGEVSVGDVDIVQEPYGGKVDIPGGEFDADIKGPEVDSPDLNVELPEGEFEGELPEGDIDVKGPKWKLKGPHFKGPNIKGPSFSLPKFKGRGGQGEVSVGDVDIVQDPYGGKVDIPGGEIDVDIKGPEVDSPDLHVEVPEGQIEGELPEGDVDIKGPKWKIKGPHFKTPHIKGPNISLPKWSKGGQGEVSVGDVDIIQEPYGGKLNIEGGDIDLDVKGPGVESPDLSVEVPEGEIEGELPEGDIDVKGPKWKLKGPHFKGPNIKGPSFSLPKFKGRGGQGEVSVGDVDVVQEPYGGKVDIPGGEFDVDIKGPEVDSPDLNVELPEGEFEGELPEGDVDIKGPKWKIKGPHFKGPNIKGPNISLPKWSKGGQGEVSVGDVDIVQEPYGGKLDLPSGKVDLDVDREKIDIPGGELDARIKGPEVEAPDLNIEVPEGEFEGELPEGDIDIKGPKWKIKGPHFKTPKIKGPSFSLPKWSKGGQGEISVGEVDTVQEPLEGKVDIEGGDLDLSVKGPQVEAPDLNVEVPEGEIEGELPKGEIDVKGPKWKIKGPHFKAPGFSLPKWSKGKQPEAELGDVHIVKEGEASLDIKGTEIDTPELSVEHPKLEQTAEVPDIDGTDLKGKGRKWKIKGPSFSLPKFSRKKQGHVEIGDEEFVAEPYPENLEVDTPTGHIQGDLPDIQAEAPKVDIDVEGPDADLKSKGGKWKLKGPQIHLPKFSRDKQGEVEVGEVDVVKEASLPEVDVNIPEFSGDTSKGELQGDLPSLDISKDIPEDEHGDKPSRWKIKGPKFSLPKFGKKTEGDTEGVDISVSAPGVDTSQLELKGEGPDVSVGQPSIHTDRITVSPIDKQGEVTIGDSDVHEDSPGFLSRAFGKIRGRKKGSYDVTVDSDLPGVSVDSHKPEFDVSGASVDVSAPELSVEGETPGLDLSHPEKEDAEGKSPRWKIKGPHISLPKFTRRKQGEFNIGDGEVVEEPLGGARDSVELTGIKVKSPQSEVCDVPLDEVEQQRGERIHIKRRNIYIKGDGKPKLVFTEDTPLAHKDTEAKLEGRQIRWSIKRPKLSLPKFTTSKQEETPEEEDFEVIEYQERILNERGEEYMEAPDVPSLVIIDGHVQPSPSMEGSPDTSDRQAPPGAGPEGSTGSEGGAGPQSRTGPTSSSGPTDSSPQTVEAQEAVVPSQATSLETSVGGGDVSLDVSVPEITVTGGQPDDTEEGSPDKKDKAGKPPKSPSKSKGKFFGLFSRDKKDKDSTLEKKKKKKKRGSWGKSDDSSSVGSKDSRQSMEKDLKDIDAQIAGGVKIQADTASTGSKDSRGMRSSADEFVPMEEDSPEKLALATSIPKTTGSDLVQGEAAPTPRTAASQDGSQTQHEVTSTSQQVSSQQVTTTTTTRTVRTTTGPGGQGTPQTEHLEERFTTAEPTTLVVQDQQVVVSHGPSGRTSGPESSLGVPAGTDKSTLTTTTTVRTTTLSSSSPGDVSFDSGAVLARGSHRSSVDSGTGSDPARPTTHFVVVAIDFGTTFSGYAFSFTRDPDSIHMMRKWEGGDPGVVNQKTPTCLLLNPDGQFNSFGFSARDNYHDLDQADAHTWLFFDKFKMSLHYSQVGTVYLYTLYRLVIPFTD